MKSLLTAVFLCLALVSIIVLLPAISNVQGLPGSEIALAAASTSDPQTSAASPWSVQGYNYPSWWQDEYLSPASAVALDSMASTGASWVAIVPTQFMATSSSNTIGPDPDGQTATDAAVAKAIDDAHARGLKVMLKPHVDAKDGGNRVDLSPSNRGLWFASYRQMIVSYATLAEAHHVELFSVGTELATMSGADKYTDWANVIGGVRSVYSGPLTYAASINEFASVSFEGLLDYLGLDFYYPLSDSAQPTTEELIRGWTDYSGTYGQANWMQRVESWQARWNKPVIFTELGYRSITNVAQTPWDCSPAPYDGYNQARAYDAAFQVLKDKAWLAGIFWWDWEAGENMGGPGDVGYTVRNKPAQSVVTSWFTRGSNSAPAVQTQVNSISWNSYQDYLDRNLSVVYNFTNIGGTQAINGEVISSRANNSVNTATLLPLALGSLDSGSSRTARIVYSVPNGIDSFRTLAYTSWLDAVGNHHYFPEAPPA